MPVEPLAESTSLLGLLRAHAGRSPDRPAIVAPGRTTASYAELLGQVVAFGRFLEQHGITRGSTVAHALPNGPDAAVAFLGTLPTAACAPLAPDRPLAEHARDLTTLGAGALVVARGHETAARNAAASLAIPILELEPDELAGGFTPRWEPTADAHTPARADNGGAALLLFTSGTTSTPKLVPLSEQHLLRSAANVAGTLHLAPGDRVLNVMPLFHVHGLVAALLASITAGGSVICTPGFQASDVWRWIEMLHPTWYTAAPTIHQAMLDVGRRRATPGRASDAPHRSTLRFIRSSSAALPVRVMAELEQVFGVPVVEAYGMTEAAHQIASNPLPPGTRKPGTVGPPRGCDVAAVDVDGAVLAAGVVGEIAVRGPSVASQYLGDPAATAAAFQDGWFRTGDQGFVDGDGYVTLTGRLKEIINRGGEKVAPREIDDVLLDHADVRHAVAFGIEHPRLGEEVGAVVVLRDGSQVTAAQLRVFAGERLAPFKVPRKIVVVDDIPRGATGKFDRINMAARLGLNPPAVAERSTADRVEPTDDEERRLATIWQRILGADEAPGIDTDFFDLGADSLHATELLEEIEASFGRRLDATVFLSGATVRTMAEVLRTDAGAWSGPSIVPVQPGGSRPALFCLLRAGSVVALRHFAATLGPDQPVFGLWMPAMHGTREAAGSVEDIAATCADAVIATRPHGPYYLFGHSLGGVVIYETARVLAARGHRIGLVVVADAVHPDVLNAAWRRRRSTRYRLRKLFSRRGPAIVTWRVRHLLGRDAPRPVVYLPGTEVVVDWNAAIDRERHYAPGPAPGPVAVFATQPYLQFAHSPDLGWAPVLDAGWEAVEVPGNHDTMIGEPYVHVLAARLADCLRRAQDDGVRAPVTDE